MLSTALILGLRDLPGDGLTLDGVAAIGMVLALALGVLMRKKDIPFTKTYTL